MEQLIKAIEEKLPKEFECCLQTGMLCYAVPLSFYPSGYHCAPGTPLPFLSIASQKAGISVYHMGLYSDPKLLKWFTEAYAKTVTAKLDMGKSCIRFKKPELIPFSLMGELAAKMSTKEWVETYERLYRKK
jgi:hypothetical protein